MCEPTTLAAIAVGASVLGTTASAVGQYQADKSNQNVLKLREKSEKQRSEAEASSLDSQAKEEDFRADSAARRGRFVLNRFRRQVQGEIGQNKAALAVTGVEITSGSAQRVLDDQTRAGVMDSIVLEQNNALDVWGFRSRAEKLRAGADLTRRTGRIQAKIFRKQASAVGRAADFRLVTSLVSGFGRTALLAGAGGGSKK